MSGLLALLALLSLSVVDPPGDAVGDGTLVPPTSPLYANVAMFDLQGVELEVNDEGQAVLRVTLGSLGPAAATDAEDPGEGEGADAAEEADAAGDESARAMLATQFDVSGLLTVVDVYLSAGEGGATQTLRGPNMLMPAGFGWQHAVRLSAEGAWGVAFIGEAAGEAGAVPVGPPAGADAAFEQPTLNYVPLFIERRGNELSVVLPWEYDHGATTNLFAVSGVHDPFSPDGWRAISDTPSPWAFSGGEQVAPVVDVLAADADAQARALRTGILPAPAGSGMALPLSPWLWLMVLGVAVAVLGLVLRGRVKTEKAAAEASEDAVGEGGEPGDDEVDVLATLLPFEPDEGQVAQRALEEQEVPAELEEQEALAEPEEQGEQEEASQLELTGPSELAEEPVIVDTGADDMDDALVEVGEPSEPGDSALDGRATDSPAAAGRSPFSTSVEESYLSDDEGSGFGDGDEESFWHPATRETTAKLKKTLIDRIVAAGEDGSTDSNY